MCFKAAERLQMIGLMVVMFMSYSRVVSVVLVLCGVDPNLRNDMEFRDKMSFEVKCQHGGTTGI